MHKMCTICEICTLNIYHMHNMLNMSKYVLYVKYTQYVKYVKYNQKKLNWYTKSSTWFCVLYSWTRVSRKTDSSSSSVSFPGAALEVIIGPTAATGGGAAGAEAAERPARRGFLAGSMRLARSASSSRSSRYSYVASNHRTSFSLYVLRPTDG